MSNVNKKDFKLLLNLILSLYILILSFIYKSLMKNTQFYILYTKKGFQSRNAIVSLIG